MCLAFLAERQQPFSVAASSIRRWSTGTCSASVCSFLVFFGCCRGEWADMAFNRGEQRQLLGGSGGLRTRRRGFCWLRWLDVVGLDRLCKYELGWRVEPVADGAEAANARHEWRRR